MRVVIAGAGIGGLTLALTAKQAGLVPIVVQKQNSIAGHTFGGGIGLWPPSQKVFQQLGILSKLQKVSGIMPTANYFNHKGQILGQPSQNFISRYRILCLEREKLSQILYEQCVSLGVEFKLGVNVRQATSQSGEVSVLLSSGEHIAASALIGVDGINSTVRNIIMRQHSMPQVVPHHCGYAYFRAVIDLSRDKRYTPGDSDYYQYAFQSWGEQKRFGYVPLKQPLTFWFAAIPINKYGLTQYQGSHTCSQEQKQWLLSLFQHWRAPVAIKELIRQTPVDSILRTDIRKIKDVGSFPWSSKNKKILIIGDAANATAPNLAQGAGLAIESAWDLVAMVNIRDGSGVKQFIEKRKRRTQTVQRMADTVAKLGQLGAPYSTIRDLSMMLSTKVFRRAEQEVFESVVSYSLGGSSSTKHWLPPPNHSKGFKNTEELCGILSEVMEPQEFNKLPQHTRKFRSLFIGEGEADVSVSSSWVGRLIGLSGSIDNNKFGAYVETCFNSKTNAPEQRWIRVFNEGQKGAVKYQTIHRATPNFRAGATGLTMTESLGSSYLRDLIRFGYDVKVEGNSIHYRSNGMWLGNYRMPVPRLFLPSSQWVEEQTPKGWRFDGTINYPKIIGGSPVFSYKGHFMPLKKQSHNDRKVVIAGGSGFIGKTVARVFHQKGWAVIILSRSAKPIHELPFAQVEKWTPEPSEKEFGKATQSLSRILMDVDVVINLAGQTPAGLRWTENKKKRIIDSRVRSIDVLAAAIEKTGKTDIAFLQSSAVGIYGDRKEEVLTEDVEVGKDDTFRINTVKSIENNTNQKYPDAVCLRIGHVLGSEGALLGFLKLFSILRGKKYGAGGQYMPWIHVEDIGLSMLHVAQNMSLYRGKVVNMSSPEHHTYDTIYQTMGELNNRTPLFRVPEWVFKLLLGELSCVLLESQRAHPQRLLQNGFQFKYGSLRKALTSRHWL